MAVTGLAALVAACAPVAPPPPPPAATNCAAPPDRDHDGATEFFAVVDDGVGTDETVTFEASTEAEKQQAVAQIEATEGEVVIVEPDYQVDVETIDDPLYTSGPQWGIEAAAFEVAWDVTHANSNGTGVTVAVLDTGVFAAHEDLTGGVVAGADFVDGATVDGTDDLHSSASTSHGTHVAGIVGARDNLLGGIGGAPGATILPVRVLNAQGSGLYSQVVDGINFAVANGADVVSMSLGGPAYSQALQDAVTAAVTAGVTVVAAAGNAGTCDASYPGALTGVISVAATQQSPADTLASYSQRGPLVDIAAPGSAIWSTVKAALAGVDYGQKSGTSMATPYASAAAALLLAKCGVDWGTSAPAKVEELLQSTAAPVQGGTIEDQSGAIRVDAATALAC